MAHEQQRDDGCTPCPYSVGSTYQDPPIDTDPQCFQKTEQVFLGSLLPGEENVTAEACQYLQSNDGGEDLFWALYYLDITYCGLAYVKSQANLDHGVDNIINSCDNQGYSGLSDPGWPPTTYQCALCLSTSTRKQENQVTPTSSVGSNAQSTTIGSATSTDTAAGLAVSTISSAPSATDSASTTTPNAGPADSTSSFSSSSPLGTSISAAETPEEGLSTQGIVAIVVCSVLGIIAAAVLLTCCALRRRHRRQGDGNPSLSSSSTLPSFFGLDPTTPTGGGLKKKMSRAMVASDFVALAASSSPSSLSGSTTNAKTKNDASAYQRLANSSSPCSPPPAAPSSPLGEPGSPRPPLTPPLPLRDRKLLPSLLLRAGSGIEEDDDPFRSWNGHLLSPQSLKNQHTSLGSSFYSSSRHTSESQKSSDVNIPMTNTKIGSNALSLGLSGVTAGGFGATAGSGEYSSGQNHRSFPSSPICAPTFNKLEPRPERMLQGSHYITTAATTTGSFSSSLPGTGTASHYLGGGVSARNGSGSHHTRLRSPPPVTFTFPPRAGIMASMDEGKQHSRGASSLSSSSSTVTTATSPLQGLRPTNNGTSPAPPPTTFGASIIPRVNRNDRYAHSPPTSNGYTMATITRRMESEGGIGPFSHSQSTPRSAPSSNPFLEREGEDEDCCCSSSSPSSSSSSSTSSPCVSPQSSFSPLRPRRPHEEPLEIPDLVSPNNPVSSSSILSAPSSPPPCRALPHVPSQTGSMIGIAKTTTSTPSSPDHAATAASFSSSSSSARRTNLRDGASSELLGLGLVNLNPSRSALSLHLLAEQHRRHQRGEAAAAAADDENQNNYQEHKFARRDVTAHSSSRDSWGSWGEDIPHSPSGTGTGDGGSDDSGSSPTTATGSGKKMFGVLFPPPPPPLPGGSSSSSSFPAGVNK